MVCTRTAYNAVVGRRTCLDSLLYEARGVLWADRLKPWKQLLDDGFCSCFGEFFFNKELLENLLFTYSSLEMLTVSQ